MDSRPSALGTVLVCSFALAVAGCTTTGSSSTSEGGQASAAPTKKCNPVLIGLGAAAVCGIAKKDAAWAAGCAALAVAGCIAFNSYQVKKARTAEQVAEEYSATKGALPDSPTLVSYTSNLTPSGVIPRGQKLDASVELTVVPSKDGAPVLIEDEWTLYDAKGEKWWGPIRKPFNDADQQAGAFVGGFSFKVPEELPQGKYEFRNRVFLNGVEVQTNSNPIQVAALDAAWPAAVLVASN